MLEFIIEFVLEIVGESLFQVILELLAEVGLESLENSFRGVKTAKPVYAGVGFLVLGAAIGLGLSLVFPDPVLHRRAWPGISLVLSPLGTGLVMHLIGYWRRERGGNPTCLATFWGGACFAFGMALVRFLMVGSR